MLGRKEERKKELDQQEGPLLINFCVAFKDHARIPPVFLSPPLFFPPATQLPEQTPAEDAGDVPAGREALNCSPTQRSAAAGCGASSLEPTDPVSVKSPSAAVWTHAGGAERRGSGRADQLLLQE